jgi:hypothetical protein
MIESQNNHCKQICPHRDTFRAMMAASGYIRYEGVVRASDIYVHPQSLFQMPAHIKANDVPASAAVQSSLTVNVESTILQKNEPVSVVGVAPAIASTTPPVEKSIRMQKYVTTYKYKPPENPPKPGHDLCGTGPDFQAFFNLTGKERSRLDEDKTIYNLLFKDKLDSGSALSYIELGAFDGIQESNTRFFDLCLGWKGLLIEGKCPGIREVSRHQSSVVDECPFPLHVLTSFFLLVV